MNINFSGEELEFDESAFSGYVGGAALVIAGFGRRRFPVHVQVVGHVDAQHDIDSFQPGVRIVRYFQDAVVRQKRLEIGAAERCEHDAALRLHLRRPRRVHFDARSSFLHDGRHLSNPRHKIGVVVDCWSEHWSGSYLDSFEDAVVELEDSELIRGQFQAVAPRPSIQDAVSQQSGGSNEASAVPKIINFPFCHFDQGCPRSFHRLTVTVPKDGMDHGSPTCQSQLLSVMEIENWVSIGHSSSLATDPGNLRQDLLLHFLQFHSILRDQVLIQVAD